MSNIGDGFKNIFLAGLGAIALTGEKGKEIIDDLVARGESVMDQSRELNQELHRKTAEATVSVREGALEARMRMMTPEEREEFATAAARIAKAQNEKAAAKAAAAEAPAEEPDIIDAVAEAVEGAADAVAEAIDDVVEAVKGE